MVVPMTPLPRMSTRMFLLQKGAPGPREGAAPMGYCEPVFARFVPRRRKFENLFENKHLAH